MTWIVVHPDRNYQLIDPPSEHGATLAELQHRVGGLIEFVDLPALASFGDIAAVINEEGNYGNEPVNTVATTAVKVWGHSLMGPDGIRGPVVFVSTDQHGNTVGLPADLVGHITSSIDLLVVTL